MEENNTAELEIQVSIDDATKEELDKYTRLLRTEIEETHVEAKLLKEGTAPEGTMSGDVVTIGSIAVAVLPSALSGLFSLVQDWAGRGRGRTIKFKYKGLEYEGSQEGLEKILEKIERGKKKK